MKIQHHFLKTNRKTLFVAGIFLIVAAFAFWLYQDHLDSSGRLYASQSKMCEQFAKSYLRTMREEQDITDLGGEKWQMAIDIETEIHKLCQLELTREAINDYEPSALDKYSVGIAEELQDCLPKSDMASKEKCDELLLEIANFDECVGAGFPVMESYPEQCRTADGRTFVNQ